MSASKCIKNMYQMFQTLGAKGSNMSGKRIEPIKFPDPYFTVKQSCLPRTDGPFLEALWHKLKMAS